MTTPQRILVSGATGLIGSALVTHLTERGDDVVRLVRRPADAGEIQWDPESGVLPAAPLEGVHAVINLGGAGIADHRWTDEYKATIRRSRVAGTSLLARTIAGLAQPPAILASASAIGYYGDRDDQSLDETSAPGDDFLAGVCVDWEQATAPAEAAGITVAHLRTGIVLSPDGGALAKQLPLFKLGLGGRFGSGKQWQSWITLEDEIAAIAHVVDQQIGGPVNLTAPAPVTNRTFVDTLASVLHRPHLPVIPSIGPKLLLGRELAEQLLFTSQRVAPTVLQRAGYQFCHPELDGALRALLGRKNEGSHP